MEGRSREGAEQDLNLAGPGDIPEASKGLVPLRIEIMISAKQFPKQGSRHMGQQALPRGFHVDRVTGTLQLWKEGG